MPRVLTGIKFRYVIKGLHRVFWEGSDISMIWPHVWPLLIMAEVTLPAAAWLFRRRSE